MIVRGWVSMKRDELLQEINKGLPKGIDWKQGARDYVKLAAQHSTEAGTRRYALTKPMYALAQGEAGLHGLIEAVAYLNNFTNTINLLKLPAGARVIDVACGAGWLSHYLARFGYDTFGFDIAPDFIELARERISSDPHVKGDTCFDVLDIEAEPLPQEHHGSYDAIILESCLHHFYDPISALEHLVRCLKPDGVVLLIEGENLNGPIQQRWMDVMTGWATIERPYPRNLLIEAMKMAGLSHYEFFGQVNGYLSPQDPIWGDTTARLRETEREMNLCVAAPTRAAIDRVFPNLSSKAT